MISLDDIKKAIEDEKKKISMEDYDDVGIDYCSNYILNNNFINLEQFTQIDIWGFLKCLTYTNTDDDFEIDDCFKIIDTIKKCIGGYSYTKTVNMIDMLLMMSSNNSSIDFFEYIHEEDSDKANSLLVMFTDSFSLVDMPGFDNSMLFDYKEIIEDFRNLNDDGDIDYIVQFIKDDPKLATVLFTILKIHIKACSDIELLKNRLIEFSHLNNSMKKKVISSFFDKYYNADEILDINVELRECVRSAEREKRDFDRKKRKIYSGYDRAIDLLQNEARRDEIKKTREIIRLLDSDEIKRMTLQFIAEHNKDYYDKLDSELDDLKSNSINVYYSIFTKHKLDISLDEVKEYMNVSIDDLEFIICAFRNKIDDSKLLYLLKHSNRYIVEQSKKYLDLGFISSSFISENICLLDSNCSYLDQYEKGLDILSRFGINPQLFISNPLVLVLNNELLNANLLLLEEYEILRYIKNACNFMFLLDEELSFKLDKLLEFGYIDFLIQDIDCLNKDKNRFLRFDLLNKMNMPVDDLDSFMDVMNNDRFIVDDSMIEEYLLDVSPYHGDDDFYTMEDIENNRISPLIVSINDEAISYPKIRRRMSEGYSLKDAVCYGKYFSEEEYSSFIDRKSSVY